MRSTMSLFSCVVPNFTKQSYKDFESVQMRSGRVIRKIFSSVDLIVASTSNPCAIPYSSEARTLRVTLLHLIEDQCSRRPGPCTIPAVCPHSAIDRHRVGFGAWNTAWMTGWKTGWYARVVCKGCIALKG